MTTTFLAIAAAFAEMNRRRFFHNASKSLEPMTRNEDVSCFAELSATNKLCARQVLELASNYLELNGHTSTDTGKVGYHPLAMPPASLATAMGLVAQHRYGGDTFLVHCARMRLRERLGVEDLSLWEQESNAATIISALRDAATVHPEEVDII